MHKIYLSLILVSFAYAQSVSFDKILETTIKNSKDLQKQKLNIESSKLDIENIDAVSYGKFSLSEEISRTNHAGYVFNYKLSSREASFKDFGFSQQSEGQNVQPKDLNYPEARNNFNTKLTYDIPLFTGFKLSNQKDILKLQKQANTIKYNLDVKELEFEVLKAYNSAVIAKDFIKALEKAKEAITFMRNDAIAFHKEGLVTKIDVNEAKVYESNINSQLLESKNNFQLALAYLSFLSSDESISDVEDLKNLYFKFPNEKELYSQALENRDEVKMQNIQVNASKKNIDIAKAAYYPSVFSRLEYGFNDDTLTLSQDKDYYMAMVGITITLFDNTRSIEKQKSQIEYQKANLNEEKLKDAIKLELKKAMLNLETIQQVVWPALAFYCCELKIIDTTKF